MSRPGFHASCGCSVLALALGAPAWASAPADVERLYQQGEQARLAGRPAEALALFEQGLALQPDNPDLLLQQGLALSASGRDAEAIPVLQRVLLLAPGYADASAALARIHARQVQAGQAAVPTPQVQRFRLDLGASHSRLSGDRPAWKEGAFRLAYKASADTTVSGGIDISRRYRNTDTYGELRVDQRFSDRLASYAYAGGTPGAHFLPRFTLGLGGDYRLNPASGPHSTHGVLDLRHARYTTGEVNSAQVGIVQYLGQDRVWLTAKSIHTLDENRRYLSGMSLRLDWQMQPDLRVLAGWANAPETSDGATVRTRTVFGGVVYDFTPAWGVNLNVAREQRAGLYDRSIVAAGMTYRF